MIDANIVAQSYVKKQDIAADNTMRVARAGLQESSAKNLGAGQAEKVAQDFEALFISQMLTSMFGESLGEDAFGSKETSDVYRSMMVEQYGKQITQNGGIGMADYIKTELLKLQEVKP